ARSAGSAQKTTEASGAAQKTTQKTARAFVLELLGGPLGVLVEHVGFVFVFVLFTFFFFFFVVLVLYFGIPGLGLFIAEGSRFGIEGLGARRRRLGGCFADFLILGAADHHQ